MQLCLLLCILLSILTSNTISEMKKIYYNKLIRDAIPEKIEKAGADYEVYELDEKRFEEELIKKVEEEASGMQSAETKEDLIGEIADVIDVIVFGPIPILDILTDVDVRVVLDLTGLAVGTQQLRPMVIILPDRIQLQAISPETVQVVITEADLLSPTPTTTPTLTPSP